MSQRIADRTHDAAAKPFVSLLCVTYNHETFVTACIEGFLMQEVDFPVEIVVHDDASTDRTQPILLDYAKRYPGLFRFIFRKENVMSQGGVVEPDLIAAARGNYIAWCDGDDAWTDPLKVAKQVAFLEANPSFVVSFHDAERVDAEGNTLFDFTLPEESRRDYTQMDMVLSRWGFMLLSTMTWRNVLKTFPPEYSLAANNDVFIARLLGFWGGAKFQGDIRPIKYTQHAGGIWAFKSPARKAQMHARTHLQLVNFFLRIGKPELAILTFRTRLVPVMQEYERELQAARQNKANAQAEL
ncbi:MAG TPA: glycosyltransferase [Ramlibacter sp.]|uniref:glycosyltransferase family 2 protein n=1 Tax=Ramlibacter sp. TaxID=1917967 RepID=UPI002CF347C3|nr:glycosyltransferase [Ramlibacter sp.]HVZ44518.1 glycosyltransferase [Ramlibacter sp.]